MNGIQTHMRQAEASLQHAGSSKSYLWVLRRLSIGRGRGTSAHKKHTIKHKPHIVWRQIIHECPRFPQKGFEWLKQFRAPGQKGGTLFLMPDEKKIQTQNRFNRPWFVRLKFKFSSTYYISKSVFPFPQLVEKIFKVTMMLPPPCFTMAH